MKRQDTALATTPKGNLALLTPVENGWELHHFPRWLGEALGYEAPLPAVIFHQELPDHPFEWMIKIADEVQRDRLPVNDYFRELQSEAGEELALFIHAGWREDIFDAAPSAPAEEGVLVAMRDVTEIVRDRRRAAAVGAFHGLIGQSIPMLEVYHRIAMYGPTDAPVIITGETGTGKELVARSIHERSKRVAANFVAVNCAALSVELFESELFGHEKGSFTGAVRQHRGRFERADGGTLFLDEIGEMPLMTQAKLLRALEEGVIERVGGEHEQRVDVRLVAATNIPLEKSVAMRQFRPDLYHRLSVLRIHLPPLRERRGDIPLLVDHYLEHFNRRYDRNIRRFTPEALHILEEYWWPGNIRELRNVVERLVVETHGDAIGANSLMRWVEEREYLIPGDWNADAVYSQRSPIVTEPQGWQSNPQPTHTPDPWQRPVTKDFPAPSQGENFIEAWPITITPKPDPDPGPVVLTKESIANAYENAKGNLTKAAAALGVHKATLYRHMKQLSITRDDLESMRGSDQ